MGEQKSKYVPGTVYTQQFDSALPDGWGDVSEEATPIPSSLPTLLAGMVNEYHGALKLNGYSGFPDRLVEGFNQMLLACAQPAITAYLEQLTTPPKFVVREQ